MSKKNSYITVTDQFCGAGGSGQGARNAGLEIKIALNHWERAVETYNTNFKHAPARSTDISACDPRRYPSTHFLITSPECTTHTPAGGNTHKALKAQMDMFDSGKIDPSTERSRATMWDVCRFAEYHRYKIIIVENVIEAKTRWPLFDIWLSAMRKLGYNHRCLYFNSMHFHPVPQSRDRMYVVFWDKSLREPDLNYTPRAFCDRCGKDVNAVQSWKNADRKFGKFNRSYVYCCPVCSAVTQPYYYAAFNCIDWSDIGTRIGDRQKPLSSNSMRRIRAGKAKFGNKPFLFHTAYGKQTERRTPFIIDSKQTSGVEFRVKGVHEHLPAITTQHCLGLLQPPFIVKAEHSAFDNVSSSLSAIPTQCTRQTFSVVTPPFIVENKGTSTARSITDPLAGQTTNGYCGLITSESWNSFIHYNYGKDTLTHITDALGAATCTDRHSLVNYSENDDVDDYYYRMLKPGEVKLAMAFGRDYIVTGSGKDQVRQLGNAVTPPVMEWIITQCAKSL